MMTKNDEELQLYDFVTYKDDNQKEMISQNLGIIMKIHIDNNLNRLDPPTDAISNLWYDVKWIYHENKSLLDGICSNYRSIGLKKVG